MNWRRFLKIAGIIAAIPTVAVIGFIVFLFFYHDYVDTEKARYPNPSGSLEAVVVERNGGATTTFVTRVYIVAKGAKPGDDADLVADYVEGLDIYWLNDERIVMHMENARIFFMRAEYSYANGALKDPVRIRYEIVKTGRPD